MKLVEGRDFSQEEHDRVSATFDLVVVVVIVVAFVVLALDDVAALATHCLHLAIIFPPERNFFSARVD